MRGMAAKFTMDAADTEAGLSTADAAVAQKSGSSLGSLCVGGYMTSLVGATLVRGRWGRPKQTVAPRRTL